MASQVEVDPQETREWLEALDAVVASDGPQRAQFLLCLLYTSALPTNREV